ncbi:MAG TPA: glycosyltransferase [Terriglobia bacterium]|nr:glycosyltransferase [Terriglobia bacterium]
MNPLVSIIVNNYNYGRFVGEAIDSALGQTYRNTEVMVVDDGSTDNSREVIAGYGSRIIPVLKENGGQGSAFNAGMAASRGELIFFLDSDDFFYPEKVATIERAVSTEFAGKQVMLYHPMDVVDQGGTRQGTALPSGPHPVKPNLLDYARKYGYVPFAGSPTSGLVITRELARRIFPVPETRICADDFVVRAAALLGEVHWIPNRLGAYRAHEGNNYFCTDRLKSRAFMQDTVNYLNAKLVENKFEPLIDYFRSPLSVRYAEGDCRQLWSLGWAAVRRHPSPGMMWFCLTTELKALRCALGDGWQPRGRTTSGEVRENPGNAAQAPRVENPSGGPIGKPLVSIIVNNYNYGRFLWQAIDSALAQSYPQREVIVVDDGSRDNSREVIAGYGELIIPVLKENGGQASAFNAGFAASTGDLILFLDSDDMLEPNAIETAVREWRDGLGMVFFPLRTVDANGRSRGGLVGGTLSPGPLRGPFCFGSPTSGNVFSRKVLEQILPMPTEGWRISADFYLTATASLFGGARRLERPLGMYRVHGMNNEACAEETSSFRSRINLDLRLYDGLSRLMDGRMTTLEKWLGACPQHWVRRIKLLRERPDDYPWTDSLAALTARAAKACWREPNRTVQQRLAYTAFVVTYGLLPRTARTGAGKLLRWMDGQHPGRTYRGVLGT